MWQAPLCLPFSLLTITIVGTTVNNTKSNKVLIACVCFSILFFACSWGPCAWVVTGELFPVKARAKCLSMTTASNRLLNWAIGYMTPYVVNAGPGGANSKSKVFFVWGGCCFICIAFVYFFIYETKGLSLEHVDELYSKVGEAWQSKGFVPKVSFTEVQALGQDARHNSIFDLNKRRSDASLLLASTCARKRWRSAVGGSG